MSRTTGAPNAGSSAPTSLLLGDRERPEDFPVGKDDPRVIGTSVRRCPVSVSDSVCASGCRGVVAPSRIERDRKVMGAREPCDLPYDCINIGRRNALSCEGKARNAEEKAVHELRLKE